MKVLKKQNVLASAFSGKLRQISDNWNDNLVKLGFTELDNDAFVAVAHNGKDIVWWDGNSGSFICVTNAAGSDMGQSFVKAVADAYIYDAFLSEHNCEEQYISLEDVMNL